MSKPSSFSSASKIAEIFPAWFLTLNRRARSLNCGIAVLLFTRDYRTGVFGGFWFEKQKRHRAKGLPSVRSAPLQRVDNLSPAEGKRSAARRSIGMELNVHVPVSRQS